MLARRLSNAFFYLPQMLKSQIVSQRFPKALRLRVGIQGFIGKFYTKFMQEQEVIIYQEQAEPVSPAPASNGQEIEFLKGYEIKNWEFSPRIYKILAASAIFNILALVVFAQTNILQMRACDSPWVNRVCQVIDTVYVGSSILNTDSAFVDKPYERTELEDAEIVWINQTGNDPLQYPEGYFALANPESQFQVIDSNALPNTDFQAIPPAGSFPPAPVPAPSTPGDSGILNQPQVLPPRSNNPVTIPDSPIGNNPIARNTRKGNRNAKPDVKTTPENEQEEKTTEEAPTVAKSDPVTDVELNRRPLVELGEYVNGLLNEKKVDLNTPFIVQAKGKLNKDGKLDEKSYKVIQAVSPDEDMITVVQRSIAAINDSGYLQYLQQLSGKDLSLMLKQDETGITAVVESEVEDERRAESLKSTLNLAISLVKYKKESEIKAGTSDENDLDDLELLKGATIETSGKKIVIKFNIKKEIAQPMIKRKLLAPKGENSAAQADKINKNSGK